MFFRVKSMEASNTSAVQDESADLLLPFDDIDALEWVLSPMTSEYFFSVRKNPIIALITLLTILFARIFRKFGSVNPMLYRDRIPTILRLTSFSDFWRFIFLTKESAERYVNGRFGRHYPQLSRRQ